VETIKNLEGLIRYAIPGYATLFPFYLLMYYLSPEANNFFGIIFLALGFCTGFVIQQAYMLLFESKGKPFEAGGYANAEKGGRRRIIELASKELGRTLSQEESYVVWEYFIYSDKVGDGLRRHISRSWGFIHSNRTVALSCILGFLITLLIATPSLYVTGNLNAIRIGIITFLLAAYLISAAILSLKGGQITNTLTSLEEYVVARHSSDIKELIKKL